MIGKAEGIQGVGNKHIGKTGGTKGDKTTKKLVIQEVNIGPTAKKAKWAIVITAENC